MYQLNYQCKNSNEILTIEAMTENKVIELYRREISINPEGYKIINIIDLYQLEEEKEYIKIKENCINDIMNQVNKIVKSLIKKPYNKNGKIIDNKQVTINNKSIINDIKNKLENAYNKVDNYLYMYDNKINIYLNSDIIKIYPTNDYYMQAD